MDHGNGALYQDKVVRPARQKNMNHLRCNFCGGEGYQANIYLVDIYLSDRSDEFLHT